MNERLADYYLARGFIEAEDKVLDIDCGDGCGTVIIADRAFYTLGVDRNLETSVFNFEVLDFLEFAETIPRREMEVAVAFGLWHRKDINNITKRLITNQDIDIAGWTEICRFNRNTPIIIYDRE